MIDKDGLQRIGGDEVLGQRLEIIAQGDVAGGIDLELVLVETAFRYCARRWQAAWRRHRQVRAADHQKPPGVHGCEKSRLDLRTQTAFPPTTYSYCHRNRTYRWDFSWSQHISNNCAHRECPISIIIGQERLDHFEPEALSQKAWRWRMAASRNSRLDPSARIGVVSRWGAFAQLRP